MEIDWNNPASFVSIHFTIHEATFLPHWGVNHLPTDEEKIFLVQTAGWMDEVRERLGRVVKVHCWIRPEIAKCPGSVHDGENYNAAVGGASKSAHRLGRAVDFDAGPNYSADRKLLMPLLVELDLRMEDREGPWIHLDDLPVPPGHTRFFKP